MGPFRSQKGTYSRAKQPPETEEERRKHFKQRKAVPKFSELFLTKDENEPDPFDILLEDENAFQENKSKGNSKKLKKIKKPLSVNNSVVNSLGNSHVSPNDTFDKLFKDVQLPPVDSGKAKQCSSLTGSSLEVDGVLYESLHSRSVNHSNEEHSTSDEEYNSKKGGKSCVMKTGENKTKNKYIENIRKRESKTKIKLTEKLHQDYRKDVSKISDVDFKIPIFQLQRLSLCVTPRGSAAKGRDSEPEVMIGRPTTCEPETKDLPFEGKSSKNDLITSTPADVNRLQSVLKSGRTWSIQSTPTLEHTISPVPKESFIAALNNSSNFESPISFKTKSLIYVNHESGKDSSISMYKTCNSKVSGESLLISERVPRHSSNITNLAKGYYQSNFEPESGVYKGTTIHDHERAHIRKNSISKKDTGELDTNVNICNTVSSEKVTSKTPKNYFVSTRKTRQKIEGDKNNIYAELEISGDISGFEKSMKSVSKLETSRKKSKKIRKMSSKLYLRKASTEPSPVLNRLRQKAQCSKNCDITFNVSTSQCSEKEVSVVIRRRRLLQRKKSNFNSNRHFDTTDTETSFVIPRRPTKKISQKKKIRNKSLRETLMVSPAHAPEESPIVSPSVCRRKSARLYKKHNLEESKLLFSGEEIENQDSVRIRTYLKELNNASVINVQDINVNLMSFGSVNSLVLTNFCARKERRGDQMVYCKLQTSDDMFETSEDHISEKDQEINCNRGKVSENENIKLQEKTCILPLREVESNHSSIVAENKILESATQELEDVCISPKIQCLIPRKTGKGWRRSCLSMADGKMEYNEKLADRRHTVHSGSYGHREVTRCRISAIPSHINRHIQQMESDDPECDVNSSHHSSFHVVVRTDTEPLEPLDPKEHVLSLCSQVHPVPVNECFTESRLINCKKIGEGVYGEVFMTRPNPNSLQESTVLKVMPIEGDFDVNGEPQKKFGEIVSEIVISLELSNLRKSEESNWTETFVNVLHSWCVEGSYLPDLLHLWDVYHEEKGSENDRPDIFPDSQLYIVLEFGHGGSDLESYVFNNAGDARAVFLQIAYSLAAAEQELEFEHRDLHWGNVLVATTKDSKIEFKIAGATYTLNTKGLKATVIDFTLSRLRLKHCVMYNNLGEDPSLFTAEGDYQFEIYRQMKQANGNDWEKFTPYTNVLWLHYILDKMINECYYKNMKTKVHTSNILQLKKLKGKMLDYESATDFVFQSEMNI